MLVAGECPCRIAITVIVLVIAACSVAPRSDRQDSGRVAVAAESDTVDNAEHPSYPAGPRRWMPDYLATELSPKDVDLLRRAYGIRDPHRLYMTDSADDALLKYDTEFKKCNDCFVNSYRVGYVSVRLPSESWEDAEARVRRTAPRVFAGPGTSDYTSTASLDPDVRAIVDRMLAAARMAGFHFHVVATYRSPLREAYIMAQGRGRTHTLTSSHSYGRAIDVIVDDGRINRPRTRRDWIAFREWVIRYHTGVDQSFHILGTPDDTWDWPHIELPSPGDRLPFARVSALTGEGMSRGGRHVALQLRAESRQAVTAAPRRLGCVEELRAAGSTLPGSRYFTESPVLALTITRRQRLSMVTSGNLPPDPRNRS